MNDSQQIGANIRSLRCFFGETQEQLGLEIGIGKNAISNYEKGIREPDNETMAIISKHYLIPVEEILNHDLTPLKRFDIDKDTFPKNIDVLFPIVSPDTSTTNIHFIKAYDMHRLFYGQMKSSGRLVAFDIVFDSCTKEYIYALQEGIKEAAINLLALWYLYIMIVKIPIVIKTNPTILKLLPKNDGNKREKKFNKNLSLFVAETKEIIQDINNTSAYADISYLLTIIKSITEESELADYYLALQYIFNLVDNDYGWLYNARSGFEMLNAFTNLNNIYAIRFLNLILSITETSSQIVDDK